MLGIPLTETAIIGYQRLIIISLGFLLSVVVHHVPRG
jgi:hypothetical protein